MCVHYISPHAVGSGIPTMKATLSGAVMDHYLSARTLLAKALGLCAALGGGLPIGKEASARARTHRRRRGARAACAARAEHCACVCVCVCRAACAQGPFVHMSSCIAHILCRSPLFAPLFQAADADSLHRQFLSAGCAAGVSATFGSPVGGVLFSIEVRAARSAHARTHAHTHAPTRTNAPAPRLRR